MEKVEEKKLNLLKVKTQMDGKQHLINLFEARFGNLAFGRLLPGTKLLYNDKTAAENFLNWYNNLGYTEKQFIETRAKNPRSTSYATYEIANAILCAKDFSSDFLNFLKKRDASGPTAANEFKAAKASLQKSQSRFVTAASSLLNLKISDDKKKAMENMGL